MSEMDEAKERWAKYPVALAMSRGIPLGGLIAVVLFGQWWWLIVAVFVMTATSVYVLRSEDR